MKVNDEYKVIIESVDDYGNGIARINRFVVFISNSFCGEELLIRIDGIKKRFAVGSIVEIIKSSEKRKKIECEVNSKCGACSFLHTDSSYEIECKINKTNKLFNIECDSISSNLLNYRNKATFHIENNIIGYYSEFTHNIIPFNNCLLLDKRINTIYSYFKGTNLNNIESLVIRCSKNEIMVIIGSKSKIFNAEELINLGVTSIYLNNELIYGNPYIIEEVSNYKFSIYPESFFQVNTNEMINLYNKVLEYVSSSNNLLDLYCGTGTIGIYLHNVCKHITGIEINESSIKNANINKELNNIDNIDFICSDAVKAEKDNYDTIVVDPPRSGLSMKVINFINHSNAKKLIYVSCDQATLKRDIMLLNYEIKKMAIVNMFYRTKHVETVVLLNRK